MQPGMLLASVVDFDTTFARQEEDFVYKLNRATSLHNKSRKNNMPVLNPLCARVFFFFNSELINPCFARKLLWDFVMMTILTLTYDKT